MLLERRVWRGAIGDTGKLVRGPQFGIRPEQEVDRLRSPGTGPDNQLDMVIRPKEGHNSVSCKNTLR